MYATVAFCHQRICKADIALVDVSEACRERGIKTVAVSAGYITLLAGSASTSPAPSPPRLGGLFVRAEENVIC